jgi:hypothetical protein
VSLPSRSARNADPHTYQRTQLGRDSSGRSGLLRRDGVEYVVNPFGGNPLFSICAARAGHGQRIEDPHDLARRCTRGIEDPVAVRFGEPPPTIRSSIWCTSAPVTPGPISMAPIARERTYARPASWRSTQRAGNCAGFSKKPTTICGTLMARNRQYCSVGMAFRPSPIEWLVNLSRYRIERRMPTPIASEAHEGDFVVGGHMRCSRGRKPYNAAPRCRSRTSGEPVIPSRNVKHD